MKTIAFLGNGLAMDFFRLISSRLPEEYHGKLLNIRRLSPFPFFAKLVGPFAPSFDETYFSENVAYDLNKTINMYPSKNIGVIRHKLQKRAERWHKLFTSLLKGVDVLVVWNGLRLPISTAIPAAKKLGIIIVYAELGAIPGTIAFDANGVNYSSSISSLDIAFLDSFPIDPTLMAGLKATVFPQRPFRKSKLGFAQIVRKDPDPPSRFLLFAQQVHDDSQLLVFGGRFSKVEETLRYVDQQLKAYNRKTGQNIPLVVKEHPSDFGRYDLTDIKNELPDVLFFNSTPFQELLTGAVAVVTVNSSVGIQALFANRQIIILGKAFYAKPGLGFSLAADESLAALLEDVMNTPVDRDLVLRYIYYLIYKFLVRCDLFHPSSRGIDLAVEKIIRIVAPLLEGT